MTKVAIVDFGMGNLWSIKTAVEYLGFPVEQVTRADKLQSFRKIIIPGVGSFQLGMQRLKDSGLDIAIREHVNQGNDILGICLGMQLLCGSSTEGGKCSGLGIVEGDILNFRSSQKDFMHPVPHMGFNKVEWKTTGSNCLLCEGLGEQA
ncbi:MAG: imidazole glycerol phosphate synthase subunit HisH, partial [Pseudomonadota bacterium]|nr:imidazole glycerol phosphate synthase subunit HisH [Pseudomonadota bacterium]